MNSSPLIREATPADIPALAHLHVIAWRVTYENIFPLDESNTPTFEVRERQWVNAFKALDRSWFCFVVEENDTLIGFAKGVLCAHPDFPGELNKIYLLRDHHRKGLGKKLMGYVARRFLSNGISSMLLYAEPLNPSCRFFERLGAEKLFNKKNEFHGGYGWRDLEKLAVLCSFE